METQLTKPVLDASLRELGFWLKRWEADPVAYVMEAIGDVPTHQQVRMMRALKRHSFVSARSGHGVGKSRCLAWIVHWYLDTHYEAGSMCRVPITGSGASGLQDVLWSEVARVNEKKLPWLAHKFKQVEDRFYCLDEPGTRFARLRTARKENPEALQGFHRCLWVLDEASNIEEQFFEVAGGAMGDPGSLAIMTGNPTRTDGYFARSFTRKTRWHTLHFPSTDSLSDTTYRWHWKTAHGDIAEVECKGLQTREWVENEKQEYGENSAAYRVRVLGEIADAWGDRVVEGTALNDAWERSKGVTDLKPSGRVILGVDPAWFGDDDTGLVVRQGDWLRFAEKWNGMDTWDSAQRAMVRYKEFGCDLACVDVVGVGAGVYDSLRRLGANCMPVNVTEIAPEDTDAPCLRLRDWLWWRARQFFRMRSVRFGGDNDTWRQLKDELALPLYDMKQGKVAVERKEDMKKRGLRSPNLADAANLTLMVDFTTHLPVRRAVSDYERRKRNKRSALAPWNWKIV